MAQCKQGIWLSDFLIIQKTQEIQLTQGYFSKI